MPARRSIPRISGASCIRDVGHGWLVHRWVESTDVLREHHPRRGRPGTSVCPRRGRGGLAGAASPLPRGAGTGATGRAYLAGDGRPARPATRAVVGGPRGHPGVVPHHLPPRGGPHARDARRLAARPGERGGGGDDPPCVSSALSAARWLARSTGCRPL